MEMPVGGGGGEVTLACLFFTSSNGCFLNFGGSELVRGWFGTHSVCMRVFVHTCLHM